jgi:cobalt/nickel transport system permease protein
VRHDRIERWSRGDSPLHRRHAAVKILVALALLISIGTLTRQSMAECVLYLVLLIAAAWLGRLPVAAILLCTAAVLPFALFFAAMSLLAGDPAKAALLVVRAWLSALVTTILVATTPMPRIIAGLEMLHAPRFLLQVIQFLYRYLALLAEEAATMLQAGSARAGSLRTLRFRQAGAIAGVLFARSYARAQAIHRAMISRGFEGRLPSVQQSPLRFADACFGAAAVAAVMAVRAAFLWG